MRDFAALRADAFSELTRSKDEKIRNIQIETEFVTTLAARHAERLQRVYEMQTRIRKYRGSLEDDANRLVEIYRQANLQARRTPAPAHFYEPLHFKEDNHRPEVLDGVTHFPLDHLNECARQVVTSLEEIQRSFPTLEQL